MAEVTAAMVKEIREKTGARLLDCQKALKENDGQLEKAIEWLRKKNLAASEKTAARTAAEGLLGHKMDEGAGALGIVQLSANTDFVTKNEEFKALLQNLTALAFARKVNRVEDLLALDLNGLPAGERVKELAGKIGENIQVQKVFFIEGAQFGFYVHFDNRQAAVVEVVGVSGEEARALGKDLAMHVVFAKPRCLTRDEISPDLVAKETGIIAERLKNDPKNANKPPEVLKKIAQGLLGQFFGEVALLEQPYYREAKKTVAQVLKEKNGKASVKAFHRIAIGQA